MRNIWQAHLEGQEFNFPALITWHVKLVNVQLLSYIIEKGKLCLNTIIGFYLNKHMAFASMFLIQQLMLQVLHWHLEVATAEIEHKVKNRLWSYISDSFFFFIFHLFYFTKKPQAFVYKWPCQICWWRILCLIGHSLKNARKLKIKSEKGK